MRVVITGGSGNVGQPLIRHLDAAGHDVLNLDVVRPPRDLPGAYQHTDLTRRDVLEPRLEAFTPDAVVHLGEVSHVNRDLEERVYARNAAITGTVFCAVADLGLRRLAYASSCQVYGQFGPDSRGGLGRKVALPPVRFPLDEREPPRPGNGYGAQKVAAEAMLGAVSRRAGGPFGVALRLPHVLTPRSLRHVKMWFNSRTPPVHEFDTWIWCEDAASAFEAVVAWEGDVPPWHDGTPDVGSSAVYNVAAEDALVSPDELPMRDRLLRDWPDFPPLPDGWPEHRTPYDSTAFREATGWRPRTSPADVIDKAGLEP